VVQIPGRKLVPFYRRRWFTEFVTVVPPVIAGGVTAYLNYIDPLKRNLGILLFAGLVWLIIASLLKVSNAHEQDRTQEKAQEHEGLLGAVHTLYGSVDEHRKTTDKKDAKFRATIHRVVFPEASGRPVEELEQLLNYIGEDGTGARRRFSVRSGIIGRAVREKAAFAFSRQNDDYEEFIRELVRNWSYTEADALKLKRDRKSWMAVPIFGLHDTIVAVVFLDSNHSTFFTKEVQQIIINASGGITSYIHERYKRT
jgi:hypothetical protein